MKIEYKFATKELASMAAELEPILEMVKQNCIDFIGVEIEKLRWREGHALIDIEATMGPKHINAALENQGYDENNVVGVNNHTGICLFNDDVNGCYMTSEIMLFIDEGKICAEYSGNGTEEDQYHTFNGF